jgi:hypothetical protein
MGCSSRRCGSIPRSRGVNRGSSESVPDPAAVAQQQALAHCAALSLAGGGFRLPSIAELLTLVDPTRSQPAIDPIAFPGTAGDFF